MPKRNLNCMWCKPHHNDETKLQSRIDNTEYVKTIRFDREVRVCLNSECGVIYLV